MGFLRTLFWIAATVVVVVFSARNWFPVTIGLFGGLEADVKLPVLLLIAFLLGFAPLYAWHRATRWRDRRRIDLAERGQTVAPAPVPAAPIATAPSPQQVQGRPLPSAPSSAPPPAF